MAGACQYFSGRSRSVERQEEEAKAASDECIPTNQPYSNSWHCFYWPLL